MNVIPYPKMVSIEESTNDERHLRYLNLLSKVASDIPIPVKGNNRMSACVVYKNDIVAFGVNERKSHPFQARYSKNDDAVFLHAETSAIKNALKYITVEELEKSTLYICRIKFLDTTKKQLVFGLSKPCPGCFRCINTFNLKKVVYTLDNCGYETMESKER